jgi:gliding motility-associated-like protein
MPTLGTSDYFNSCSIELDGSGNFLFSVPENYYGYQMARTGEGYAGLVYTQLADTTPAYSEYIQVELIQPLAINKVYELTFFVHNPSVYCPNSIGCYFSDTELSENTDEILLLTPQFQSDLSNFICDTLNWIEMKGHYLANGGEKFISIGIFTPLYELLMTDYQGNLLTEPGGFGALVGLYIDDVSLIETEYSIPNVFTPNGDGINDVFKFENSAVGAKDISIINRWGNIVYSSSTFFEWDGKSLNSDDCADGVYFYIIKTKENIIKNGFVSLVR